MTLRWTSLLFLLTSCFLVSKVSSENTSSEKATIQCLNGGKVVQINETLVCSCPLEYIGKFCEIPRNKCDDINDGLGILTCPSGMKCERTTRGGFNCINLTKTKKINCHEKACPEHWTCFQKTKTFKGFNCQPLIASVGDSDLYWDLKNLVTTPRHRRKTDDFCNANLCQNSFDCFDAKCKCIEHYEGHYCEREIDYCVRNNPCGPETICLPKFGSYECQIKEEPKGTRRLLSNYGIVYQPVMFTNVTSYLLFYTMEKGHLINITFNFDDGRPEKTFNDQEIYFRFDISKLVERFIYPPINLPAHSLFIRDIRHKYTTPGFRKITVKGIHNGDTTLFTRRYPVRIENINKCGIQTKLYQINSRKPNWFLRISRLNNLVLTAGSTLSCVQHYINYTWTIKQVDSKDEMSFANVSQITFTPYASYGLYTINVTSYLLAQNRDNRKFDSQIVQFEIVRKKISAHIDGGSSLKLHYKEFLMLDASKSIDPNYYLKEQPVLNYSWICYHSEDLSCNGDVTAPIETSKTLSFSRSESKVGSVYTIKLIVTPADGNTAYSDEKTIKVTISGKPLQVRINCLVNCQGNRANPQETIILQGWCINCENPDWKNSNVLVNGAQVRPNRYNFRLFRFTSQSNIFLRKNLLEPNHNYTITLMVSNNNEIESCDYEISTFKLPRVKTCSLNPLEGFAIYTNFTLDCSVDEESNKFVTYIVYQLIDKQEHVVMVTYDFSGSIAGMILSPGTRENDYETMIRVVVRDELNVKSLPYNIPVTVYPAYAYIPNPLSRLYKFQWIMQSNPSPVALLSMGNDFPLATQIILVSATSLRQFAHDDEVVNKISSKTLREEVEKIEYTMLSYLNDQNLLSHLYIAHRTDVVRSILELSDLENSNLDKVLATQILMQIITHLAELERLSFFVTRLDFDYIIHNIMRIIKYVLRGVASSKYCGLIETMELDEIRAKIIWEQKQLDDVEKQKNRTPNRLTDDEAMEKFPYNIFSVLNLLSAIYLRHVMPYKVEQFTTEDMAITLHKIVPRLIAMPQLQIGDLATFTLYYSRDMLSNRDNLVMNLLAIKENPIWKCRHVTTLPFVQFNITNAKLFMYREFEAEIKFKIARSKWNARKIHVAKVPMKVHWILQDTDIQIYRVYATPKNYQFIHFKSLPKGLKIMIVIKTTPPTLKDFWNSSITLSSSRLSPLSDHTIFVEDDLFYENKVYYLGILCHEETVRYFLSMKPAKTMFARIIRSYDPVKMEKQLKHVLDFKQNVTVLDIPFSIHQSRCFSMDSKRDFWFPNCKVMPETSHDGVVCRCFNTTQVTANLKDATCKKMAVHQTMKQFKTTRGGLDYFNIWIVTLMGGLLVFYLVVFNYAQGKDVEDAMKPHLIYLADNDPSFKYKYLVGVYTGMRFNAGTSSNVTIVLEGTNCRSLSHVLQSLDQPVMTRGSHDWFLIRTKYNLGNILRVHLWTDYSGSSPEWYCQKIFIQDTKTRHVWVFNVERWFSPLVNDGTMACTSYQAKDQDIFRFAYRFNHCMNLEIQMGTHIALSIFNQNPFSGFSRAQRATVFMAYACMLFYGTILITDYVPPSESFIDQIGHDFQYRLKMIDVIKGIFIALLVWPLRFILALCCRFLLYDDNPKTCVKWTKIEKNSNVQELQTTDVNEDKTKDLQPFICKLETCVTKTSPETLNLVPFMTENIYKETMYIAPGLIFLWWTLMIVIILSCIYKTIIHGFGLEDVQIKQFFVLSKITLVIGIGILETFILFVWVLLKTLCSSSFIWIEDRTIEVRRMVIANKLPKNFIGPAQLALAKLRRGYVYRPLDARKCGHYKKISLMLKDYKGLINVTVLMAMMLGTIVLLLNEMYDPGRNLMGYKTERLLETRLGHRTMSYKHVRNIETFYQYINETILMNLYENFYGEQTGIAVDGENYLVGVPRVRQVRVAPVECQTECNFTDLIGFDTENYDPNWRLRTDEDVQENDTHLSHMWHYKEKDDLMISGRHSEYPISGYLTMLRRSSKQSQKILDYMIEYNWLGNRTRAAFIDFVLYNPKMNFLTLVQIVAEKVNFIEFSTSLNLQLINFYPENSQEEYFKLKILLFFLGLTIFLAYHELLGARNKTYWILNVLLNVSIVYVLIAYVSYYWALGKFESFIEKLNLNIFYNFYPLIDLNHAVIMNCVCVWVLIAIRLIHMICKIFFTNESMKLLEAKIVHYRKNLLYFLLVWSIFIVVYTIYNVVHVSITRISDQILLTFHTAVQRMLAMPSKYYRNQYVAYISVAVLSFFTLLIVLVIRWMLEYYIYCEYLENKKQEKAEISAEKLDAIGHLVSDMFMQNIGVEETKIDNKKIDRHGEREKAMASLLLSAFKPEENDPDESDTNEKDEVPEELIYRYKRSLDVINDFSMKMQNLETILQNTLPLFTNEMQKDEKNNTESIDQ